MKLNRETIKRMVGQSAAAGGGTGGGGSVDLTGYATEAWVNENYLSIEFFSSLFKAYDSAATPNEIEPNDGNTTAITNIKAMFGFWTEQYLSALGLNSAGGGGGASSLDDLQDVNLSSPTNGQALVYNATSGKWENQTIGGGSTGTLSSVGLVMPAGFSVSPGTLTADGSFTVSFDTGYGLPLTADVSKGVTAYNWGNHANAGYLTSSDLAGYATESWVGQEISDMATQTWVNLQGYLTAASLNGYATQSWVNQQGFLTSSDLNGYATELWVNQQGYLTAASLNGYATQSWVGQQGFLTSSDLNGYATESWVGNNYLPLTGGTLTGDLRLKNSSNYGMHLYFGDGSYCYLHEDTDDHLVIHASKGVKFDLGTNYNATIGNDIIATQPWVADQNYWKNGSGNHPTTLSGYGITDALGNGTTFWGQTTSNGAVSGNMTSVGSIASNGEIKTSSANAFRLSYNNAYGVILRNDATNFRMLLTDSGFADSGTWNTLRPITVGLSSGLVTMENGLYIQGASQDNASVSGFNALRIGDAVLSWDSTNDALKVQRYNGTAVNFYSLGGVSALGLSAGANGSISKLTITEELKIDNSDFSHTIYDDGSGILHINASEGLEIGSDLMIPYNMVVANEMKSSKFYLDSTRYIYLDGTTLKYYNGSQSKTIVLS